MPVVAPGVAAGTGHARDITMSTHCRLVPALLGAPPLLLGVQSALGSPINQLPSLPYAYTSSAISVSIALENASVLPGPGTSWSASTSLEGAAIALGADDSQVAHQAAGNAVAVMTPADPLVSGGVFETPTILGRIDLTHATAVQATAGDALFARAMVKGVATIDDLTLQVLGQQQPATLHLTWNVADLGLTTGPTVSFAYIGQTVTVLQTILDAEGSPVDQTVASAGFAVVGEDGRLGASAWDLPGSSAVLDWLGATLTQPATADTGFTLSMPLGDAGMADGTSVAVTMRLDHVEYAAEAPPAAAPRTGPQAGSAGQSGRAVWNAATGLLSIDPLSLDILSAGAGATTDPVYADDPLSGGFLVLDPLRVLGAAGGRTYFAGGTLRLLSSDGDVLYWANTPGLVFDEALVDAQGFTLFAPLLNSAVADAAGSAWLADFIAMQGPSSPLLPELFLALDMPAGQSGWNTDFMASVTAVLSFAGAASPEVPVPGSLWMLGIGLAALAGVRRRDG